MGTDKFVALSGASKWAINISRVITCSKMRIEISQCVMVSLVK